MNIYRHELKLQIKSVISWSIALFLLIFIYMSVFSGIASEAENLNELLEEFPKEFLTAFGMNGIDLSTVLGFFGMIILFCQICVAIQAANYGFALVSVEERELTADFLLSKPVGRYTILSSKLLAALTSLTVTNIAVWIGTFLFVSVYRDGRPYDAGVMVLLLLTVAFVQLFFLAVGLVISLLVKKIRSVTPYSMGLVFGLYVLSAFGGMIGDDKLSVVTPFKHFEANYIVANAGYDVPLVLLSMAVIILSVGASYLLYGKRDIQSV